MIVTKESLKNRFRFLADAELDFDAEINSAIEYFCMEVDATSRASNEVAKVNSIKTIDGRVVFDVEGGKYIQNIAKRYDEMINGPLALGFEAIKQRADEFDDEE